MQIQLNRLTSRAVLLHSVFAIQTKRCEMAVFNSLILLTKKLTLKGRFDGSKMRL